MLGRPPLKRGRDLHQSTEFRQVKHLVVLIQEIREAPYHTDFVTIVSQASRYEISAGNQ